MNKEYTEQELIKILLKHGLKISLLNSKHYLEKGYFHSGGEVPSFIRTAEQLFTSVELKINPNSKPDKNGNLRPYAGKKRRYIVGEMRENIAQREDNRKYNSFKSPPERTAIINKIHEKLHKYYSNEKGEQRLSTIVKTLGFQRANQSLQKNKEFIKRLRQAYNLNEKFPFYKEHEIVKEVTSNYNSSITDIVEQALEQLSKDNKLVYSIHYYGVNSNGEAVPITRNKNAEYYQSLKDSFSHYFSLYKTDIGEHITFSQFLYQYRQMKTQVKNDQVDNEIMSKEYYLFQMYHKIYKKVLEETGLTDAYRKFKISSVENVVTVENEDINELFKRHYLRKTRIYRYENYPEHFRESTFFWRRFFYLSATIFLEREDKEHLSRFEEDLERYAYDYYNKFYNRDKFLFADDIDEKIQEHVHNLKLRSVIPIEERKEITNRVNEVFSAMFSE